MPKYIVIEGSDSSGKQTQSDLLYEHLKKTNKNIFKLTFPDYASPSSSIVKMYLNGDFGKKPNSVDPKIASLFYAVDRYASYKTKWEDLPQDSVIIFDRYVTSNMLHQAAKIDNKKEKDEYLDWVYELEYEILGLPKPNIVIFLDMPPNYAQVLMKNRQNKITNEIKKDIHEQDANYLEKCYNNAIYISEKYQWKRIFCVENDKLKTIKKIQKEIQDATKNNNN